MVVIVRAVSATLIMWQMRQMPRASGLRGPPEVEKKCFSPSVVKQFDITSATTKKLKWAVVNMNC